MFSFVCCSVIVGTSFTLPLTSFALLLGVGTRFLKFTKLHLESRRDPLSTMTVEVQCLGTRTPNIQGLAAHLYVGPSVWIDGG